MMIFGFEFSDSFTKDEFSLFLSCLFGGVFNLVILKGNRDQIHKGFSLCAYEIELLVDQVFPGNKNVIERSEFM